MLLAALSSEAAWWTSEPSSLARELTRSADKHSAHRIAVLPLRDQAGKLCHSGAVLADRLILELVRRGVEVIERSRLEEVLAELKLAQTGAIDPSSVKRLGKILGADAVVTGTVVELVDGEVEVLARLVHVETGRVLSASQAKVAKDWVPGLAPRDPLEAAPAASPAREPRPERTETETFLLPGIPAPRRSAAGPPELVKDLESCESSDGRLLDARARYWALRMKDPAFSLAALQENPGSEIADRFARQRFYDQLRAWHAATEIPPLSPSERILIAICR